MTYDDMDMLTLRDWIDINKLDLDILICNPSAIHMTEKYINETNITLLFQTEVYNSKMTELIDTFFKITVTKLAKRIISDTAAAIPIKVARLACCAGRFLVASAIIPTLSPLSVKSNIVIFSAPSTNPTIPNIFLPPEFCISIS